MLIALLAASILDRPCKVDIPTMPVTDALNELGKACHFQLIFFWNDLQGYESPKIKGTFPLREIMRDALSETPYVAVPLFDIRDTITLVITGTRETRTDRRAGSLYASVAELTRLPATGENPDVDPSRAPMLSRQVAHRTPAPGESESPGAILFGRPSWARCSSSAATWPRARVAHSATPAAKSAGVYASPAPSATSPFAMAAS